MWMNEERENAEEDENKTLIEMREREREIGVSTFDEHEAPNQKCELVKSLLVVS